MTVKDKLLFQDLTAWFSDSVADERKSQWKKMGGKEADLDTAQFIFSENPESGDTQQIFKSEPYRNEHLAVFHARYISDCIKANGNHDIPVGKYFMPPKEIQELVRKQMKFIWDNYDSGVSSDESDSNQTPQKTSKSRPEYFGPKQLDRTTDKQTLDNRSTLSCLKDNTSTSGGHKQGQDSSILSNSPAKNNKPEQNTIKSPNTCLRRQKPEEKLVKSPTKTAEHSYTANSSLSNMAEERQSSQKSINMSITSNYSLRKRTSKNYRDTTDINVDNIILDNTESTADSGHSKQNKCDLSKDFLCIEDLPKETGEIEVVVPGKNGFEVLIKN